ncbi:hypothetical protein [Methanoregula sp. UBA64]|uniref:hypothetical protein n=1 Tax=Methanoregula sp. UBA64 TaxID=1915554 RepID=UPI0025FB51C4|nr:hypothetical protein [Methanoregula sp. UBA64]
MPGEILDTHEQQGTTRSSQESIGNTPFREFVGAFLIVTTKNRQKEPGLVFP